MQRAWFFSIEKPIGFACSGPGSNGPFLPDVRGWISVDDQEPGHKSDSGPGSGREGVGCVSFTKSGDRLLETSGRAPDDPGNPTECETGAQEAGKEAKLSYSGGLWVENRNGLKHRIT